MASYRAETYDHPSFLVRFPHRRRMRLVADLILRRKPRRWLDFGAGDGALIRYLRERGALSETQIVAYEPVASMFDQLVANLGHLAGRNLVLARTLDEARQDFDLVTALEVLEHLRAADRAAFYAFVAALPSAECLVEVPVESGPVLVLKELGRVAIKKRPAQFTPVQLSKAALGLSLGDLQGRYDANAEGYIFTHFGFELSSFEAELSRVGAWRRDLLCPFPRLPRGFNQCALYTLQVGFGHADDLQRAILGSPPQNKDAPAAEAFRNAASGDSEAAGAAVARVPSPAG